MCTHRCPNPDLCRLLLRAMCGRRWAIWTGLFPSDQSPLSPSECAAYRVAWCREAGVPLATAEAMCPPTGPSPQAGMPALPPLSQQAMNFVSAATRHLSLGSPKVPTDEEARRHDICKTCDRYRVADDRCSECGCFLLGSKVAWADQVCPIGKWGEWKNEVVH